MNPGYSYRLHFCLNGRAGLFKVRSRSTVNSGSGRVVLASFGKAITRYDQRVQEPGTRLLEGLRSVQSKGDKKQVLTIVGSDNEKVTTAAVVDKLLPEVGEGRKFAHEKVSNTVASCWCSCACA
jgi:hypothetical protein